MKTKHVQIFIEVNIIPLIVGIVTLAFTKDIVKAVALATMTKTFALDNKLGKLEKEVKALTEAATSARAE